jgi:hypothetical protein
MKTIRSSDTALAIACLCAALACEKPAPPAPPADTPAPAAVKPAAPAAAETPVAAAPPVQLEAVPAREDFEEEAETQITAANLEKELQALEKEIASE